MKWDSVPDPTPRHGGIFVNTHHAGVIEKFERDLKEKGVLQTIEEIMSLVDNRFPHVVPRFQKAYVSRRFYEAAKATKAYDTFPVPSIPDGIPCAVVPWLPHVPVELEAASRFEAYSLEDACWAVPCGLARWTKGKEADVVVLPAGLTDEMAEELLRRRFGYVRKIAGVKYVDGRPVEDLPDIEILVPPALPLVPRPVDWEAVNRQRCLQMLRR